MPHNLQIRNTGLDHLYVNGIPIVEASVDISDIFKKAARKTSLTAQADPWFNNHTQAQKLLSELHGEGDRISRDFLEEGAKDILPVFQALQRLIPEGVYDSKNVDYAFNAQSGVFTWDNPDYGNNIVKTIYLKWVNGAGTISIKVNNTVVGSVELPETEGEEGGYLAYDLAFTLGGSGLTSKNYDHLQNVINEGVVSIELTPVDATSEFSYDVKIAVTEYNGISWNKALTDAGDVRLPKNSKDLLIAYLHDSFAWVNKGLVEVSSVLVKSRSGSAEVLIDVGVDADYMFVEEGNSHGVTVDNEALSGVHIYIDNASDNYKYDLIITANIPDALPSPRFEFDSNWNPGKIIYRWEWPDTRKEKDKLNYTDDTILDIRIDKNTINNVKKYVSDALVDFMLKELYRAIGYDKKYSDYLMSYENHRRDVAYWVKNRVRIQDRTANAGW